MARRANLRTEPVDDRYTAFVVTIVWLLIVAPLGTAVAEGTAKQPIRLWPDNLFGVEFVDSSVGVISGYAGTILRTEDGGATWQSIYIGVDELIRRICFVDRANGWAVGHRGSILHTADGGLSWSVQHAEPNTYLRDIHFVDTATGWAVGHDAKILHTTDGGSSWERQALTGFKGRDAPRLHGVHARSESSAILVGEFGVVARTGDSGANWLIVKSPTKKTLLDVAGTTEAYIAVGLDGTAVQISNTPESMDATVRLLATGTDEHIFAVAPAGHGRFVMAGRSIVAVVSDDAVAHMTPDQSVQLPFVWFGGVDVLEDGSFWLAGIRGVIAKGNLREQSFEAALQLGRSSAITIGTSRWETAPK